MATATLLEAVAEYGPQWRRIYAMYGPRGSITPRSLPAIASLADLAAHAMQCVADGTAPAEVANAAANPSTFFADMDVVVLPSGELGGGSAPPMPLPLPLSSPAASSSLAAMTPMSMMLSGGGPAPLFAVPASAPPPPPSALMATTTAVPEGESEALLRAGAKRSFAQSAGGTEAADAIDRELYQLQA
ncbi:hypothetical protein BC828DRAFT_393280 [Blastocladiella britannica]|nr:hypothetical protein BC828DRAFT_393280 [Blastocladiella britannica]